MREIPEEMEALMSGHLDGELTPGQEATLKEFLSTSEEGRAELERLRGLVDAASRLSIEAPPEEVWDTFYDNIYNQLERRSGWFITIVGATSLVCYVVFHFMVGSWASPIQKLLIAGPLIGLFILFVSVLRQRIFVAKTDRYSREVKR